MLLHFNKESIAGGSGRPNTRLTIKIVRLYLSLLEVLGAKALICHSLSVVIGQNVKYSLGACFGTFGPFGRLEYQTVKCLNQLSAKMVIEIPNF